MKLSMANMRGILAHRQTETERQRQRQRKRDINREGLAAAVTLIDGATQHYNG